MFRRWPSFIPPLNSINWSRLFRFHILPPSLWNGSVEIKQEEWKEKSPLLSRCRGILFFLKGLYKFSRTTASIQSKNKQPKKKDRHRGIVQHQIFSFTLHYASYWKHSVACKIYILANACYVLMCPNWYLADFWGETSWIFRKRTQIRLEYILSLSWTL